MSWENIPASLTCEKAKIPPRSLALAAGAIMIQKLKHMYQFEPKVKLSKKGNPGEI